jgi:hypothetical protein
LKQSARLWNKKITKDLLTDCQLHRSENDPCLFYWRNGDSLLLFAIVVDDVITLSIQADEKENEVMSLLKNNYKIEEKGDLLWALGMEVVRSTDGKVIQLTHKQYIEETKEKLSCLVNAKVNIPVSPSFVQDWEGTPASKSNQRLYRSIVGSWMHSMVTVRPDVCYAVGKLTRKFSACHEEDLKYAKQLSEYLINTKDLCMTYDGNLHPDVNLEVFVDSDYGGTPDCRKSTTGYVIKMAGGVIMSARSKLILHCPLQKLNM